MRIALFTLAAFLFSNFCYSQEGIVRAKNFSTGSIENRIVEVSRTDGGYYAKLYNGPGVGNSYTFIKVDTAFNEISRTSAGNGLSVLMPDGGTVSIQMLRDASHSWSDDYCVARFNQYGVRIWSRYFGGTGTEIPYSVMVLNNGNIMVSGTATSMDGDVVGKTNNDAQIWVIEVSPDGSIVRQRLVDTYNSLSLFPSRNGFYLAGHSADNTGYMSNNHGKSDISILRFDANWNINGVFCLGGAEDDGFKSLLELPSGELLITGFTSSVDGMFTSSGRYYDGLVAKISSTGDVIWTDIVSGIFYELIFNVVVLDNGDIAAAGYTTSHDLDDFSIPSNHTYENAIVYVLDSNGHKKWTKVLGSNCTDMGFGLTKAYNGNLIVGGLAYYCSTDGDFQGVPIVPGESIGFLMEVKNNYNILKGSVFYDENANGNRDVGEQLFLAPNNKVASVKGTYSTKQMLSSGKFLASVDSGIYTTSIEGPYLQEVLNYRLTPKYRVTDFRSIGESKTIDFRFVPNSLVNQDLSVSLIQNSTGYLSNTNRFKLILANTGGMSVNNAVIRLKTGNYFKTINASRAISAQQGDTVNWTYSSIPAGFRDTIDIFGLSNGFPILQPGQKVTMEVLAEPYLPDFDTVDNRIKFVTIPIGQNSAVSGLGISAKPLDSIVINRTNRYDITYQFSHLLDSIKGAVVFRKSSYARFIQSTPMPARIQGDSIIWNFKDLSYLNTDTIHLMLAFVDSAGLAVGGNVSQSATIQLFTSDTAQLSLSTSISQKVEKKLAALDMVNTELAPPNGLRWIRAFGGSDLDQFNDLVEIDGGLLVVGTTASTDGDINQPGDNFAKGLIAKFDKDGHLLSKTILATPNEARILFKLKKTRSNSYLAVGSAYNAGSGLHGGEEAWLIKFNASGDLLWSKTYGSPGYDYFYDVDELTDGSIIAVGMVNGNGGDVVGYVNPLVSSEENGWVVHLDSMGNVIRQKCVNLPSSAVAARDLSILNGNQFLIGGRTATDTSSKGFLAKMDTTGNVLWLKEYSISGNSTDLRSFVVLPDSSITATGYSGNTSIPDPANVGVHGSHDVWVANFSKNGDLIRQKYLGGKDLDLAEYITTLANGHFLVGGLSHSSDGNLSKHFGASDHSDGWLFEMDANGNIIWQKNIGGSEDDVIRSMKELVDGSIVAVGNSFSMSDGDIHGGHGQADALLMRIAKSNLIKGEIFIDLNNNDIRDNNEPYISDGRVSIRKMEESRFAIPVNGQFSFSTDTGKYYVSFETTDTLYYSVVPPLDSVQFVTFPEVKNLGFHLKKRSDINDLGVELIPVSVLRPGFNADYILKYINKGTTDLSNIVVKLAISNKLTYLNAAPAIHQLKADTLIWNVASLASRSEGTIAVSVKVNNPPSVSIGDWLYLSAMIDPIAGDTTARDNVIQLSQLVRGSYDPNDKSEIHGGRITPAMVEGEEYLTYMVRFQNTGNDTAFNVFVRDTLDSRLDWSSLKMVGSSHPYSLSVTGANKLEWAFSNINLPDSNINEPLSHGFVSFKIKLKKEAVLLDTIVNHASIYFDFNLPVVTNEVRTVVDQEPSAGCPGSTLTIPARLPGSTFQWQLNTGAGYVNISNNSTYQGAQTAFLKVNNLQSSYSGYKVRCLISADGKSFFSQEYVIKTQVYWDGNVSKLWENPLNWNCGILPDAKTEVIIRGGLGNYPEVNSMVSVKSLIVKPGASVLIKAGFKLELTGKGKN